MVQALIGGFVAILCAVLGSVVTVYVQSILRKEKYQEIIYKEWVPAYKEIAEIGFKVWYGCLHLAVDHKKLEDLAADARRFQECLDKHRLFILGSVNDEAKKFTAEVTLVSIALMKLPEQEIKDLTLDEHCTRQVERAYYRLVNEMRKNLRIKEITANIHKTFEFGL